MSITWKQITTVAGILVAVAAVHSAVVLPLVSYHVAKDIQDAVDRHEHPRILERLTRIEAQLERLARIESLLDAIAKPK